MQNIYIRNRDGSKIRDGLQKKGAKRFDIQLWTPKGELLQACMRDGHIIISTNVH